MESYDIVVVGAGPGGSGAAYTAARKGLRVLMVEKRQEIGAPKRCGEGLSRGGLKRIGFDFDPSWARREIKGATAIAPNGKRVVVDYEGGEGWVLERKLFDKWLAEKAAEAGARVMARTEAVEILKEDGLVSGVRLRNDERVWSVKTPLVIAADGVESKLAREMGIDTTLKLSDVASGYQYEMSNIGIDPDRIELYFGNDIIAPGGYVWIFPKGERTANVGIGVRKPFAKKTAKEHLDDFIESRESLRKGSVIEVNSGAVPVGGLLRNMVAQGFMVAGDAAHQANPIHGGGIPEAFVGGRMAAEVAAEAKQEGDFSAEFLSRYNRRWWEERGEILQKICVLREVVEKLSDEELNWLADHLKGEELIQFSKSKGFAILARLLMKKPRLIPLARKLL